jgi:hypothetical protein
VVTLRAIGGTRIVEMGDMMRRILLVVLLGLTAAAFSTGVAVGKPKPKPATFKTGTYTAKLGPALTKFNLTLKRASCPSAPGQAKSSLHLCVALPTAPTVGCTVPINFEVPLGGFVAPVQLPTSGKLTRQAPVTAPAALPGGAPTTGQSTFAITFTKKGTATGYFELNLTLSIMPGQSVPCASGKVPFTAKL